MNIITTEELLNNEKVSISSIEEIKFYIFKLTNIKGTFVKENKSKNLFSPELFSDKWVLIHDNIRISVGLTDDESPKNISITVNGATRRTVIRNNILNLTRLKQKINIMIFDSFYPFRDEIECDMFNELNGSSKIAVIDQINGKPLNGFFKVSFYSYNSTLGATILESINNRTDNLKDKEKLIRLNLQCILSDEDRSELEKELAIIKQSY